MQRISVNSLLILIIALALTISASAKLTAPRAGKSVRGATPPNEVNIVINPNVTVSNLNSAPVGLVLNQMVDGVLPLNSLEKAVRMSGAKRLRFPEGETADNYYFTDPSTLTAPNPATHQMAYGAWWPANTTIADASGHFNHGLDFDQFMSVIKATGAIPNVVLCYPCVDKVMALKMAKAWVKYSKDKGYDVLDWEIGNETDLYYPNLTDLYPITVSEYAKDVIEWSAVLKAIDPRVKIGANGYTTAWFRSLLTYKHPTLETYGAQAIDFLVVHDYPMYHLSFSAYKNNQNRELGSAVQTAVDALNTAASTVDVSKIRIAVTEYNAMNFTSKDPNNLALALMIIDQISDILKWSQVGYVELWNSRYTDNFTATSPQASDAFTPTNQLHASGLALSVLSHFLKDRVVGISGGTSSLSAFGSVANATGEIDLILINRSNFIQAVAFIVKGSTGPISSIRYSFRGTGPTDFSPVFNAEGTAIHSNSPTLRFSVPATSIVILKLLAG